MSIKFAIEMEAAKDTVFDDLPFNAKLHQDAHSALLAAKTLDTGKSYRKPKYPMYFIIEWTGKAGDFSPLLQWIENENVPVTRYALLEE